MRYFTVAEFYGQGLTVANLELVARFFERYPEYADRAFLSVKGGLKPGELNVDGSRDNLRRSVDNILKALRGTKKLDLFEPARRDANYEVEHYMEVLNEMVKEGKFDYIGLSEVGAETVRRAHKVRRKPFLPDPRYAHGFLSCEIRLRLSQRWRLKLAFSHTSSKPRTVSIITALYRFSFHWKAHHYSVIATCEERGIAVVAYSYAAPSCIIASS
jgi:aryl-alcohol dehydrogenase-like predicted oxidoreductase